MTKSTIKRHNARLAAVQYLYQSKLTDKMITVDKYVNNYSEQLLEQASQTAADDDSLQTMDYPPDFAFLRKLLTGLQTNYPQLQNYLHKIITKHRSIKRTSPLILSLLEAGAYELIYHDNIKAEIILSEYTSIAADFFDNPELAFVNGLLQEIANDIKAS